VRQEYLAGVRQPGQTLNPLFGFLGMEIVSIEPGKAVFKLEARPELIQGAEKVAGGILSLLLDETMAHAVLGGNAGDKVCTTVDLNVSFYRPVKPGAEMVCEASVTKRGSRIIFTEGVVLVGETEVAKATATLMVV